jgi:hypothetical protein
MNMNANNMSKNMEGLKGSGTWVLSAGITISIQVTDSEGRRVGYITKVRV